jgi:hypothetical protein
MTKSISIFSNLSTVTLARPALGGWTHALAGAALGLVLSIPAAMADDHAAVNPPATTDLTILYGLLQVPVPSPAELEPCLDEGDANAAATVAVDTAEEAAPGPLPGDDIATLPLEIDTTSLPLPEPQAPLRRLTVGRAAAVADEAGADRDSRLRQARAGAERAAGDIAEQDVIEPQVTEQDMQTPSRAAGRDAMAESAPGSSSARPRSTGMDEVSRATWSARPLELASLN